MTPQQMNRIVLHRARAARAYEDARRRERMAEWLKVAAVVAVGAALLAALTAWVMDARRRADAAEREANEAHRVRVLFERANRVTKDSPNYGLARLAAFAASVALTGEVVVR